MVDVLNKFLTVLINCKLEMFELNYTIFLRK